MTFIYVHVVVGAQIWPIAVFTKANHFSTMIWTELLQSHLVWNSWFCRKVILYTSWFHRTAAISTSTTYDYRLIDFLRLHFGQLTAVPGKVNSLIHLIHEYVYPFHAYATYSHTNSWNGVTSSNQHISTKIFHQTRFYVQLNSYMRTIIIPWIASIASCLVVPVYSFNPVQISLQHSFASLLLQPFAFICNLSTFCLSSSINPLQGLGVVSDAFLMIWAN